MKLSNSAIAGAVVVGAILLFAAGVVLIESIRGPAPDESTPDTRGNEPDGKVSGGDVAAEILHGIADRLDAKERA